MWNVLKCEVIGKKTKEENKEKKSKGIVCRGSGRRKEERMRQRKKSKDMMCGGEKNREKEEEEGNMDKKIK